MTNCMLVIAADKSRRILEEVVGIIDNSIELQSQQTRDADLKRFSVIFCNR